MEATDRMTPAESAAFFAEMAAEREAFAQVERACRAMRTHRFPQDEMETGWRAATADWKAA